MDNGIQDLIEGISVYVDAQIKNSYSLVLTNGLIRNISSNGYYTVIINGKEYNNIKTLEGLVNYSVNDSVKILISKNGNRIMELLIIGKVGNKLAVDIEKVIENYLEEHGIVYHHPTIVRQDTTSSISPNWNDTFTVVDSVTSNETGHISSVNIKTVKIPNNYESLSNKPKINNVVLTNNVTSTQLGLVSASDKGVANGFAELDSNGKVPSAQLPSTSKSDIGLSNVDNTSDANKPISNATQTALNGKVDKVSGKDLFSGSYTDLTNKPFIDLLPNESFEIDIVPIVTKVLVNSYNFTTTGLTDTVGNINGILGNNAYIYSDGLHITYGNDPYLRDYVAFNNVNLEPNMEIQLKCTKLNATYDDFTGNRHGCVFGFCNDGNYRAFLNGLTHVGHWGASYGWQIMNNDTVGSNVIVEESASTINDLFNGKLITFKIDENMIPYVYADNDLILSGTKQIDEFKHFVIGCNAFSYCDGQYEYLRIYKTR